MIGNRASLSEEDDGGRDHCNRDDPERDSDAVVLCQEGILWLRDRERRHWSAHDFQLRVHKRLRTWWQLQQPQTLSENGYETSNVIQSVLYDISGISRKVEGTARSNIR